MKSSSTTSTSRMGSMLGDGERLSGSRTTNSAPPAGSSLTSTVPPCCAVTSRTKASPIPRPPGTSGFEVTPRAKIASRRWPGTPGPESATETTSPSRSPMHTVTFAGLAPTETSTALSIRLPNNVITSVASAGSNRLIPLLPTKKRPHQLSYLAKPTKLNAVYSTRSTFTAHILNSGIRLVGSNASFVNRLIECSSPQ